MPATRQYNRSDRVCQLSHVGVLRIGDGIAHHHATDETESSQTICCAYRDTLAGAGRFYLPRGTADSSRTVAEISPRIRIHSVRPRRVPRLCVQENKKQFISKTDIFHTSIVPSCRAR